MVSQTVSNWFPDRPPTWKEVAMTALVCVPLVINLYPYDEISWGWTAVGFALFVVALGPAGNTSFGKAVGRWFRAIGGAGRVAVIVCFVVGVWWTMLTVDLPITRIESFIGGWMVAILVYQVVHIADAGEIDGWSVT
ncbi:hypothetical protein [Haladaptatus sp. DYF46]|uniref:hypothetical protein n=1 Tax=Haladaptatus sp. DYF46 TaxID=2886041 RepID=UPI001E40B553|nr:hypothetical protein [Haladaptatus sp. DYF46]